MMNGRSFTCKDGQVFFFLIFQLLYRYACAPVDITLESLKRPVNYLVIRLRRKIHIALIVIVMHHCIMQR